MGSDSNPGGLMVYDKDLKNGRCLVRAIGHSDLALDAQGREVLVYQDNDNDTIAMCDLATGQITDLCSVDSSHTAIGLHFSGRALRVPGWALVSRMTSTRPLTPGWTTRSSPSSSSPAAASSGWLTPVRWST